MLNEVKLGAKRSLKPLASRLGLSGGIWGDYREGLMPPKGRSYFDDYFINNDGRAIHKWHHYLPLYERYFQKFEGSPVRFLEIGVQNGGSMQMWRSFFGESALIYGIDIDERCKEVDGDAGFVRIGSQSDRRFLSGVIEEMGGVDVVLDDGSHRMKDIRASLEFLFPHLSDGGVYVIEDLHTAYWRKWGGGYYSRMNFFNYCRQLVDDMHSQYHGLDKSYPEVSVGLSAIHLHDSLVVLEKAAVERAVHSVSIGSSDA